MTNISTNQKAFLDMLTISELGKALLALSDDGYNVLVGSTPDAPILFGNYADHPRRLIQINSHLSSTAAGRYQLLEHWFDAYKKQLNLPDFSPSSQDAIALQQILECDAMDDIAAGRIEAAIGKCAHIWASLPGNHYGQHENAYSYLVNIFKNAGGSNVS